MNTSTANFNLMQYKPQQPFSQKHLTSLQDYTTDEILQLLSLALRMKTLCKQGVVHPWLKGKQLAMIFAKPSARTRVSFEVGMEHLGGHALFISANEVGMGVRETVQDVARVFSRMVDGILIRTFSQQELETLAEYSSVPVINGLSDDFHPCQALADLLTLYEHKGTLAGLKLAYVGDGNNMAHSLLTLCAKLGVDIAIGCPQGYAPSPAVVKKAQQNAAQFGSRVLITEDPFAAAQNADAVYTDVWASMGQEEEATARKQHFAPYQLNACLLATAKPDAIVLHCLPAHRGEEITEEVLESAQSVVFDQAENRLHAQKAVLVQLLGGNTHGDL